MLRRQYLWLLVVLGFACSTAASETIKSFVGVTRGGTPIVCLLSPENGDLATAKTRVLMIGTTGNTKKLVERAMQWFHEDKSAQHLREKIVLSAVLVSHPDKLPLGVPKLQGLPKEGYYNSPDHAEEAYLWRWSGMHAADIMLEIRAAP